MSSVICPSRLSPPVVSRYTAAGIHPLPCQTSQRSGGLLGMTPIPSTFAEIVMRIALPASGRSKPR